MDLWRCTTQALAGAGALLAVAGLSLGGGVAVADPAPRAEPSPETAGAGQAPAPRSSSGIPPGISPIGPGTRTVGSTPAPTTAPTPDALVPGPSTLPVVWPGALGATGYGTRRLLLFGGLALLAGAVVIAFTGRDRPHRRRVAAPPAGPRPRSRPRRRRELDGWEDGIPLAPAKRDVARRRLGITSSTATGSGGEL